MLRLMLALVCCCAVIPVRAVDFSDTGDDQSEADSYRSLLERKGEEAAAFQIARRQRPPDPADEAAALESLRKGREALAAKEPRTAWKIAESAYKRGRFTAHAAELLHLRLDAHASSDPYRVFIITTRGPSVPDVFEALVELWLRHPEHPRMDAAMRAALTAAEQTQAFSTTVNLEANEPSKVLDLRGTSYIADNNRLFRFLAEHGDRDAIAPQAKLGLARAMLLGGDPRETGLVRNAYQDFLRAYPSHPLAFDALCELALSHIVSYRGPRYDVGALTDAGRLIDQAELESRGDAQRAALVQQYRARLRGWLQERDLQVARWYRDRTRPAVVVWLKDPGDADWDGAARFYYREAIRRDPGNETARIAEREMGELPPPRRSPLEGALDRR